MHGVLCSTTTLMYLSGMDVVIDMICLVTVDVTQAGEGQLEIMVNRGAVPNSVRMMSKGVFLVSFVPRDSRPHMIDIKFNGETLPSEFIVLCITCLYITIKVPVRNHCHCRYNYVFPGNYAYKCTVM